MRILLISDVHGEFEKLVKIIDHVKDQKFDLVICNGDFTDMFTVPEGFSQTDIGELVLQKILSLGKPVFAIPGNHDPYETLDLLDEYDVNLHNKAKDFNSLSFIGWGGAPTPFNTKFEPTEEETKEHLERLITHVKGKDFVLVSHNPPYNTKVDKTEAGMNVGSKVIREFIEKNKPLLCVSAHIHEAGGQDHINKTKIFYPGPAFEGFYGIIEISDGKINCESKKVKL